MYIHIYEYIYIYIEGISLECKASIPGTGLGKWSETVNTSKPAFLHQDEVGNMLMQECFAKCILYMEVS